MRPLTLAGGLTDPLTDPLTDLLNGIRTTGAAFSQSFRSGSWAVRCEDGSPLALAGPMRGSVWLTPHGGDPVRLDPGDVAVLCGGAAYVIADDPATPPDVIIGRGGRYTTTAGEEIGTIRGVDIVGAAEPDSTVLVHGLYTVDAGVPARLLATLPPLAVVEAGQGAFPLFTPRAFEQFGRPEPGQQVLLDRVLELMLITGLRAWFTRPGAEVPSWYLAHSDPVVGEALRLLHADLRYPWTVEALAAETGISRAALARRFNELVGQPPMTFLRDQRLAHAAGLLRDSDAKIDAIADRVGFSSAFALSATFKRERGISPSEYRARVAAKDSVRRSAARC